MPTIIPATNNHFCLLRIVLAAMLFLNTAGTSIQAQAEAPGEIKIIVISGEGAIHRIGTAGGSAPAVQVQDENGQPVSGATVLFVAPDGGPGGVFADGLNALKAITDEGGMAVARSFQPNSVPGGFEIRVEASYQGKSATATIAQTNVKKNSHTKILVIVGIAAGAGIGALMALKGKDEDASPRTTTISTGAVTVGPPQ